jgi:hypothetical protein
MLDLDDRIELAPSVRFDGRALHDDVRGEQYPVNRSAAHVLDRLGEPLAVAAEELGSTWSLAPEQARVDVLSFAWFLSGALLVNVRHGRPRAARALASVALALRLLPAGRLPHRIPRRIGLDTSTVPGAIVSCARAMLGRSAAFALAAWCAVVQLWLLAGRDPVVEPLALGVASGLALLAHEVAHAAALVGVPAALALTGPSTAVLHRPVGEARQAAVALAGPTLPALLGVALATAAIATGEPMPGLVACPFAGHALATTVAARDGRAACGL